jgi:hypothetical protein
MFLHNIFVYKYIMTDTEDSITKVSTTLLSNTKTENIDGLQKEYDDALKTYNKNLTDIRNKNKDYFTRISPTNRFLNKTVKFSNGTLAYVTNQGYLKKLSTQKLSDYPNIPKTITNLGINWNTSYDTQGVILLTKPQLVVGTPLVPGQTVGNEGNNVQFTTFNDIPATYQGCYDNTGLAYIGNPPNNTNLIANGDFTRPSMANWTYTNGSAGIIQVQSSLNYSIGLTGKASLVEIAGPQGIRQDVTISNAGTYIFTLYYCGKGIGTYNQITVSITGTTPLIITPRNTTWTKATKSIQVNTPGIITVTITGNTVGKITAIQDISLVRAGDFTYEQCKKSAIYQGKQFFGLQGYNGETRKGFCAVSDTFTIPEKQSTSTVEQVLWRAGTQTGNSATLKYDGRLAISNSNNQEIPFRLQQVIPNPSNYIGCYNVVDGMKTTSFSTLPRVFRLSSSYQKGDVGAGLNRHNYYMLGSSTTQCFTSSDLKLIKSKGISTSCRKTGNFMVGNLGSYAVYVRKDASTSLLNESRHFYLVVHNGRVDIHLGANEADNQGIITTIYSTSAVLRADPSRVASLGHNGRNVLYAGETLPNNKWIGSPDGTLYLDMKNGDLTIKTTAQVSNCTQTGNVFSGNSGTVANAIYKLNQTVKSFRDKLSNLAYIDADSNLHTYNQAETQLVVGDYKELVGVKISGTEQSGITDCKARCDASNDCVGYSRSVNNACTILSQNDITKNPMNADENYYSYIRLKRPTKDLYGISKKVTQADSAVYTGYNTGTSFKPDTVGFNTEDAARGVLNTKTQTLIDKASSYEDNIKAVQKQYNDNNDSYKKYTDENKPNEVINAAIENDNYMKIVDDSDMAVLQKNTTYLIWSILAVGTVLVSMSVIRK